MAQSRAEKFLQKPEKVKKVFVNVTVLPEVKDRIEKLANDRKMSKGNIVAAAINLLWDSVK